MAQIAGLNHFQIKGNGSPKDQFNCPIYKNGRQQIQVDIVIDAYGESGEIIPLTPTQLKTVRLIDYDSGSIVDGQLTRSDTKNVFDFYGGTLPLDAGSVNQNMSVLTFYISVPSSVNFAQKQVAAEITLEGATYRTNDHSAPPGGAFNNGGFNSSIIVNPLSTYSFWAADFQIAKLGPIGSGYPPGGTGQSRDLYQWEITFRDRAFRILSSDIPDVHLTNIFSQFVRSGTNKDTKHWAVPVREVGSIVYLGAGLEGSSARDVYIYPYVKHGAAYAIHEEATELAGNHYISKRIMYIDHNGCGHFVYLRPNNNGTTFEIVDSARLIGDGSHDDAQRVGDLYPTVVPVISAAITAGITAAIKSVLSSVRRR
ncbi:hypothetical protein EC919_103306 [Pseudomonas graminis]|uniref:hypothetical protein n=1 Tax=Pseudomonas graminis TaxID=158627 RepID=UPI00105CE3E2|nr:hypothetical protein [Pseudomonas graminis]TDV55761.1 hypothetical protein EC919_103306 [Pseudomonas graminis]